MKKKFYKEIKEEGIKIIESPYLSSLSLKISNINNTTNRTYLNEKIKELERKMNELIIEEDNKKIDTIIKTLNPLIEDVKKKLNEAEKKPKRI